MTTFTKCGLEILGDSPAIKTAKIETPATDLHRRIRAVSDEANLLARNGAYTADLLCENAQWRNAIDCLKQMVKDCEQLKHLARALASDMDQWLDDNT